METEVTRGEFVRKEAVEMAEAAQKTARLSDDQRAYLEGLLFGFALRMIAQAPKR